MYNHPDCPAFDRLAQGVTDATVAFFLDCGMGKKVPPQTRSVTKRLAALSVQPDPVPLHMTSACDEQLADTEIL